MVWVCAVRSRAQHSCLRAVTPVLWVGRPSCTQMPIDSGMPRSWTTSILISPRRLSLWSGGRDSWTGQPNHGWRGRLSGRGGALVLGGVENPGGVTEESGGDEPRVVTLRGFGPRWMNSGYETGDDDS